MVDGFAKTLNEKERRSIERRIIKEYLDNHLNGFNSRSAPTIANNLGIVMSNGTPDKVFVSGVLKKFKNSAKKKNLVQDDNTLRPINKPRVPKKYGFVRYCEDDPTEVQISVEEQIKKMLERGVKKKNIFIEIGHNGGLLNSEVKTSFDDGRHFIIKVNLENRPVLKKLKSILKSGDELYFWNLQKISRSVFSDMFIRFLNKKKVKWMVLDGDDYLLSMKLKLSYSNESLLNYWEGKGRVYV